MSFRLFFTVCGAADSKNRRHTVIESPAEAVLSSSGKAVPVKDHAVLLSGLPRNSHRYTGG